MYGAYSLVRHPDFLQDAKANGHSYYTSVFIWAAAASRAAQRKGSEANGGPASTRVGTEWPHSSLPTQIILWTY